jgi:hypothetical protein
MRSRGFQSQKVVMSKYSIYLYVSAFKNVNYCRHRSNRVTVMSHKLSKGTTICATEVGAINLSIRSLGSQTTFESGDRKTFLILSEHTVVPHSTNTAPRRHP